MYGKTFVGGDAHPNERVLVKAKKVFINLEVAMRRGRVGNEKEWMIAYRATSGRLVWRGTGKRRCWRQECGLRLSYRLGGGLRPRGGTKKQPQIDIARRREKQLN